MMLKRECSGALERRSRGKKEKGKKGPCGRDSNQKGPSRPQECSKEPSWEGTGKEEVAVNGKGWERKKNCGHGQSSALKSLSFWQKGGSGKKALKRKGDHKEKQTSL